MIDGALPEQQAGFRENRSCLDQVANLVEHIEGGFQQKEISGVAYVDLTAAYDTVQHSALLYKLIYLTERPRLVNTIREILSNRRFRVFMNNKSSRWRKQKNGVPQGSVLAPTLFNVYTYDLPELKPVKHFLFADDLAILAQDDTFRKVEAKLEIALKSTGNYYQEWGLNANPGKTKVCAYHLNNEQAKRQLSVHWLGKPLEHKEDPEYLGITLDRSLTYKHHIVKLKKKLQTRVNLLKQLGNSSWGSNASTIRTAALSLFLRRANFVLQSGRTAPMLPRLTLF